MKEKNNFELLVGGRKEIPYCWYRLVIYKTFFKNPET
jgi:hypothetical protein